MECVVLHHPSDTMGHIHFLHLVLVDHMDLVCLQGGLCLDPMVIWWWVPQDPIHVVPQDPWCVVICQDLMVLLVLWACLLDTCDPGCQWESLMALTCGATEAEVEDLENLFLSDSTARKGQRKAKLQLGIKQSKNPVLVKILYPSQVAELKIFEFR